VVLTDGGVYDNLGLETAWKRYETILVSDAGGKLEAEAEPKHDWARHSYRVLNLIDNQVRSLRKRQLIASYINGDRKGAYWGIRTDILNYGLPDSLPCPLAQTLALAEMPTRLKRLEPVVQERLINWGYAVCDAAMRQHVDHTLKAPTRFPYDGGVG
jgi:NTE family protein